jgi:hypothetical protein
MIPLALGPVRPDLTGGLSLRGKWNYSWFLALEGRGLGEREMSIQL